MQPLVTVVTPVYNGARYLRECIESVLGQTYSNWEYIIADNCSTDETAAISREYAARDSRIKALRFDEFFPMMKNHNRAYAAAAAKSAYVKPLMSDDWLLPECIENMVAAAEAQPSIGVVCCYSFDGTYGGQHGYPYPSAFVPGRDAARFALLGIGRSLTFGCPSTMLWRSDLVRNKVPFLNEWNLCSDVEACLDMLAVSDFSFIHQVLCMFRIHKGSVTETVALRAGAVQASDAYLLQKYGPLYLTDEEMAELQPRVMNAYYRSRAELAVRFKASQFESIQKPYKQAIGTSFKPIAYSRALLLESFRWLTKPGAIFRALGRRLHS